MSALSDELAAIDLGDERLNRRARQVLDTLGGHPMTSIPTACRGWGETQAAYRLFDNPKVTAQDVLEPHYACTEARMREHERVLCLQDTTEVDYTGKNDIQGLGPLNYETRRGLYLHPTLAVTPERVTLGLLDAWTWAREPGSLGEDKGHRPIEEKESLRWLEGYRRVSELAETMPGTQLIYVADREGDIYEVLAERTAAGQPAAEWLIRAEHDRCLPDGRTLREGVEGAPVLAEVEFDLPATAERPARHVRQTLRAARLALKPPRRSGRTLPNIEVTAVLAREVDPPKGKAPVEWLLLTSLPVETAEQAVEKLQWYLARWEIELFFRTLKSGCRIEKLQLEKLERLEPALAFYLIIAWRVRYLTMLGRECPQLPCDVVFDDAEWRAVYTVVKREPPPDTPPSLNTMVRMVASFGGFLDRKHDAFPGAQSLWIGLQRTRDFVLAIEAERASHAGRCV